MEHKTVGFAVCGSFCTHHRAMEALEAVKARYDHVIPIVSEVVADTDTRFGTAHDLMREMERICDHRVIATQKEAEPIGPKGLLDLLIIAPCTGSTLGKLACGIADTTVTLAAKAHLRNCRPILLAPSTNDGLAASARNLGQLMARKYIYLAMQRLFPKMRACESVGNNRSNPVQSRCYRHNNVRAARTWWDMTDNRPASGCYPNTAPFPVEFFSRESFCTSCFRSLCTKPHNPTSSPNTAIEKKPSAFRSAAFRPPDK